MKDQIEQILKAYLDQVDQESIDMNDAGELEYWDSGNFDDCFQCGYSIGYDEAIIVLASKIQKILNNQPN